MESQQKLFADQEISHSAENNSALQKLRHIPRRSMGSTVELPRSCSHSSLPGTSTTRVDTLVTKHRSASRSVVTLMTMSQRRQSVECEINPATNQPSSSFGHRSRSLSTCTTTSSCSSTIQHNAFIHCSTTELRSHRRPSARRMSRTATTTLADEAASNYNTSGTRDLKLNIVVGYNRAIHRKVTNVKPQELLETTECSPLIKWPNVPVPNEQEHIPIADSQSNVVACPKLPKKRAAASKPKPPRLKKIKPKEIIPKLEMIEAPFMPKGRTPRKRNVKKSLVKTETNTFSTQTENEFTVSNPWNVNTEKSGQLIEKKDENCFLPQQQLHPAQEESLNELKKKLLNFLTPQQMHCLHQIHNLRCHDDLQYLNLGQLHKMGVHQPEIILALMQMAVSVELHQRQGDNQTFSEGNCPSDDAIHGRGSEDDHKEPLVNAESIKMQTPKNEDMECLNTNAVQLGTCDQNDKALALKMQHDLGNSFQELLTEVSEIADKVLEKLLIVKDQQLSPKDKFQKLCPLYELLKYQEKRIEILWASLLAANASSSSENVTCSSSENVTYPQVLQPVCPIEEDFQQEVDDDPLRIVFEETEENKPERETQQMEVINMETACPVFPHDFLECSLGHNARVPSPDIPTNNIEILKIENYPPLCANEIASSQNDDSKDQHDDRKYQNPVFEVDNCSSTTTPYYGEETAETAGELSSNERVIEQIIPHIHLDIQKNEDITAFTAERETIVPQYEHQDDAIYSETIYKTPPNILTCIDANDGSNTCQEDDEDEEFGESQNLVINEEMKNEEVQCVEQEDEPNLEIVLSSPFSISKKIFASPDERVTSQVSNEEHNNTEESIEERDHHERDNLESSDLDPPPLSPGEQEQNIENISNDNCIEDEVSPTATDKTLKNLTKLPSFQWKRPRVYSDTACVDVSNSQETSQVFNEEHKNTEESIEEHNQHERDNLESLDLDPPLLSPGEQEQEQDIENISNVNCIEDEVPPTAATDKTLTDFTRRPSFQRKSPRLHSDTACVEVPNSQESDVTSTIEPKTFKPRRLRIPKTTTNNVDDPRKKSKSSVYIDLDKHLEVKSKLNLNAESPAQTVILSNRYFRNKAKSKCSPNLSAQKVNQKIALPLLSPNELSNEEDVEMGMLVLHSDSGENYDNSDKGSNSEESNSEHSLKTLRSSEKASLDNKVDTSNDLSRIASKPTESRRLQSKTVTTANQDPRRGVSYEDITTFSTSSPIVQIKKLKLSRNAGSTYTLMSSNQTSSTSKMVTTLKRKSLEMPDEDQQCSAKTSKVKKGVVLMTEYNSSSDDRSSQTNDMYVAASQDSPNAYKVREAESALHQDIEIVDKNATNKELMQQQIQFNTNIISTTSTPPNTDARVREEEGDKQKHRPPRSLSFKDVDASIENKENPPQGFTQSLKPSSKYTDADCEADIKLETEGDIDGLETFTSVYNKLSSRELTFDNAPHNITPIASPTYGGDCISSPSPVRSGAFGILVPTEYYLGGEIDGRITYPPISYSLFEVDLSRNAISRPLDINKLIMTNDPRIFRNHTKKSDVMNPILPTRHQTDNYSNQTPFTNDPRNRVKYRDVQRSLPPASPQPSAQNAVVCYNTNSASAAALSSTMQSSLMHHATPMGALTFAEHQNPTKVFHGYLQASLWYQGLTSTMKIQITQTISQLVRAINNFYRERQYNPEAIFDIFKLHCAGEILEILSNLGLVVDAKGMITENREISSYGARPSSAMQQLGGTTIHQHGAVTAAAISPLNATYSFIQQVLTPSSHCAGLSAAAKPLNEPFVSCYIQSPNPIGYGGVTPFIPKDGRCCGAAATGGCNAVATPCTMPTKACGCGATTGYMNHHHQHQQYQNNQHTHQPDAVTSPPQPSESHGEGNGGNDRQYNKFRKPYQNNDDSSQRSSYNQRYNNNNSRYSKPSSYSGADSSNSPNRSGSPPPSTSSSPPRGGGRGGFGRGGGGGRGRGGFGRYNKDNMRGGGGGGGGGFGSRQSSSWSSSPPPNDENSYNNRRSNNNNGSNYKSSYNSSPNKTNSSPPPPQRSPPPLSPKKQSDRDGSPVLNSPARQQQQNRPPSADEECWD